MQLTALPAKRFCCTFCDVLCTASVLCDKQRLGGRLAMVVTAPRNAVKNSNNDNDSNNTNSSSSSSNNNNNNNNNNNSVSYFNVLRGHVKHQFLEAETCVNNNSENVTRLHYKDQLVNAVC
jgi:hypothetical protein